MSVGFPTLICVNLKLKSLVNFTKFDDIMCTLLFDTFMLAHKGHFELLLGSDLYFKEDEAETRYPGLFSGLLPLL